MANVPAPQKPDEAKFKERTDEKTKQIDALVAKVKALGAEIGEALTGKQEFDDVKTRHHEALQEKNHAKQELIREKQKLKNDDFEQRKAKRDAERQMTALTKECKQVYNEDQELYPGHSLDKMIADLERKMEVSTMSLKEEKACMLQIKKLKAQKPDVERKLNELDQMKADAEVNKTLSTSVVDPKSSIEQLDKKIDQLQKECQEEYEKLDVIKKERKAKLEAVQGKRNEKDSLSKDIDALKEERKAIQQEQRDMQKAFNNWEREQRQASQKKRAAEWAAQEAEWKRADLEEKRQQPTKYFEKIILVKQTVEYCENLMPKEAVTESSKPSLDFSNAPEGAKIMVSKKDRDAEMYFSATKKKTLKKKGGDKKANIKHTPETFKIFDQLEVKAPMSVEECAVVVEQLTAQLSELETKDQEEKAAREAEYEKLAAQVSQQKEIIGESGETVA